jgi:hypothetical protein
MVKSLGGLGEYSVGNLRKLSFYSSYGHSLFALRGQDGTQQELPGELLRRVQANADG